MTYDPNPSYPVTDGEVEVGYGPLAEAFAREDGRVLAIDGPAALSWDRFLAGFVEELERRDVTAELVDARRLSRSMGGDRATDGDQRP